MSHPFRARRRLLTLKAALASALVVTACVPDVVRWDGSEHPGLVLGADARLALASDGAPAAVERWTPPALPSGVPVCNGSLVSVRARGDTAYAAWWAPRIDSGADLVVARSDDGGHSWRAPVAADSTDRARTGCRRTPIAVTADSLDGYVHVVYFMVAPEGPGLFCTHSMDGGAMFHAPVPIVYGDRASAASIATWGDTVAVAYEDPNASMPQVWLAISRTTGHIFEQRTGVSSASSSASLPAVALRGSRIAVAWYETPRGGGSGTTVVRAGTIHW